MYWSLDAAPIEEVDLQLSASADMLRMMLDIVRAELPHPHMLMEMAQFFPIQLLML